MLPTGQNHHFISALHVHKGKCINHEMSWTAEAKKPSGHRDTVILMIISLENIEVVEALLYTSVESQLKKGGCI